MKSECKTVNLMTWSNILIDIHNNVDAPSKLHPKTENGKSRSNGDE